ncbi:MAG: tRNA 2-selenouridine(34) synthase MnmH [Ferruginibacter sp.]|nr:tRNA 2-selenouridine(34) synthase MnmH [Ferruginibacter sp.]
MVQKINIEKFIELAQQYPVLDVRSPGEYTHAHLPGAYNLPLFTDEERKVVGTAYKQQSREVAIKIGLDYFGVKMRGMVEEVEKIIANWQPATRNQPETITDQAAPMPLTRCILVYCWRGGMRSAGVAWLLDLYGFKVYSLAGGYKMYRHWARAQFDKEYNFTIVGGYTGSGKTLVLHELKKLGKWVIDLEGLANHKGSAFGALGEDPQPSQEMFENLLAMELVAVSKPSSSENSVSTGSTIYIEDESQRIGLINIPNAFWTAMRKSYTVFLDIRFEDRLHYLTSEYGKFDRQLIEDAIGRIQKRLGGLETKTAINHLLENNLKECFRILLKYYDKCYSAALVNRQHDAALLNKMPCTDVDVVDISKALINKRHLFNIILYFLFFFPVYLFGQSAHIVQHEITGLWKGSLYNDTTKTYLPYQVAISEEDGKMSGYSYTLFDIDGKKEWGVKKIKIKREDDRLILEDVALIANDYSEPPPKKVRVLSIVHLTAKDSLLQLTGTWSTNQTREYRPLTGTLQVERIEQYRQLVLYEKLVALKLAADLSFVKAENKRNEDIAKAKADSEIDAAGPASLQLIIAYQPSAMAITAPPVKKTPFVAFKPDAAVINASRMPVQKVRLDEPSDSTTVIPLAKSNSNPPKPDLNKDSLRLSVSIAKATIPVQAKNIIIPDKKPVMIAAKDTVKPKDPLPADLAKKAADKPKTIPAPGITEGNKRIVVASNESKIKPAAKLVEKPQSIAASTIKQPTANDRTVPDKGKNQPQTSVATTVKKDNSAPVANKTPPLAVSVNPANIKINNPAVTPASAEQKKEVAVAMATAASDVSERKTKEAQPVFFESDSLVLTLYDNGEVDGDTVSVLMNGQVIFARQGLSTVANSKTIYFDKGMPDSVSMIMYAENLGSIPPNTGLLIIMDGEKRYEVRFSADLTTNASIMFRRKPKIKP